MAIDRMTSADIVALNSSEEIVGVIRETQQKFPEIAHFAATPVEKTTYKTLVQTGLPSVAFRAANAGREVQAATLVARQVDCKFLDASWNLDEMVARASEWGVDAACALQARGHLEAGFKAIGSQTWYGVSADAGGFAGIGSLHDGLADARTINAAGTTVATASSVFAVKFGIEAVCYAWGQDGKIAENERQFCQIFDGDGKSFWGYAQAISGYVGLQIVNQKSTGRICNLTEDSGKGLTDDLLADLFAEFEVGFEPDALFMSRRSRKQLKKSRTATNPTGNPAPTPEDYEGTPIYATDALINTEALIA